MEDNRELNVPIPTDTKERRNEIALIVNDFKVGESKAIEHDNNNIASFRESFRRYLVNYNDSVVVDKEFTIAKDPKDKTRYRVWRTA